MDAIAAIPGLIEQTVSPLGALEYCNGITSTDNRLQAMLQAPINEKIDIKVH